MLVALHYKLKQHTGDRKHKRKHNTQGNEDAAENKDNKLDAE